MFEIVQYEQQTPGAQKIEQLLLRRRAAKERILNRLSNCQDHHIRRGEGSQREKIHPMGEVPGLARGSFQRQAGLPMPPGPRIITSRELSSNFPSSDSSASRPTNYVVSAGK